MYVTKLIQLRNIYSKIYKNNYIKLLNINNYSIDNIEFKICNINPISKLQEFIQIPLITKADSIYNSPDNKSSIYFKRDIKELKGVARADMLPSNSRLPEVNNIL